MTWKEFKDMIDQHLASHDIGDDIDIWYIDISYPRPEQIEITAEIDGELSVSH
jgi:hypothetical protein